MPTIIPIFDAGEVSFVEEITRVWVSSASLRVLGSPDIEPPSLLGFEISGETASPSYEAHRVRGESVTDSLSSIDNGQVPDNISYGSLEEGRVGHDPSPGILDLTGEGLSESFAVLLVGASPSLLGAYIYLAFASLLSKYENRAGSLASYQARSLATRSATAAVSVKGLADAPALSTLELGSQAVLPALSSLDNGSKSDTVSYAAADVETGEGVDFIIDIQDEILGSGHGDC